MDVKRAASQPSRKGPVDWFTGTVRIDPWFTAPDPAQVAGAHVTFEPGARTARPTHPEKLDGKVVDWMENVTDEQYLAGSSQ